MKHFEYFGNGNISVACKHKIHAPRYAQRTHELGSLEEFYNLLASIRSTGKYHLGSLPFHLGTDGKLNISKYGFSIEAKLDYPDYFLTNKLAEEAGLIAAWGKMKPEKEKIRAFVRAFDSASKRKPG